MTRPSDPESPDDDRVNPLDAPRRRRPKQQRSRETVNQILDAAIRVMERGGFEAFTVNAIAAEAQVNVATLYSYFANKHQLLERLTRDRLDERLAMLRAAFETATAAPDWIGSICEAMERLAGLRARQSGAIALRRALHASPDLWALDQAGNAEAAQMLAVLLRARADPVPADPDLRGRIIAEYVTAILDMKAEFDSDRHRAIDAEMIALLHLHLTMP